MNTPKKPLTVYEHELVSIYLANTRVDLLQPNQAALFNSIKSQFEYNQLLSEKQISTLKNIKYSSDMAKRKKCITAGKFRYGQSISQKTDNKLNSIYNRIGR